MPLIGIRYLLIKSVSFGSYFGYPRHTKDAETPAIAHDAERIDHTAATRLIIICIASSYYMYQ